MIVSVENDAWAYECPVTNVVVATSEPSVDILARLGRPTSSVALTCCSSGPSVETPYVCTTPRLAVTQTPASAVAYDRSQLMSKIARAPAGSVQRHGGESAVVGAERAVAEHDVRRGQHLGAIRRGGAVGAGDPGVGRWTGRRRSSRPPGRGTTTAVTMIATSLPARHASTRRARSIGRMNQVAPTRAHDQHPAHHPERLGAARRAATSDRNPPRTRTGSARPPSGRRRCRWRGSPRGRSGWPARRARRRWRRRRCPAGAAPR